MANYTTKETANKLGISVVVFFKHLRNLKIISGRYNEPNIKHINAGFIVLNRYCKKARPQMCFTDKGIDWLLSDCGLKIVKKKIIGECNICAKKRSLEIVDDKRLCYECIDLHDMDYSFLLKRWAIDNANV